MAAGSPAERECFATDLRTALDLSAQANTKRTRATTANTFGRWVAFCASLGHDPTLSAIPGGEDKLCYMLAFGLRYRRHGARDHPVRAGSVGTALLAVGQGISNLGVSDPRHEVVLLPDGKRLVSNRPLLTTFLKRLKDEDAPSSRAYPANVTILRQIPNALDFDDPQFGILNRVVFDLIIVAFYWLLRPAEYLHSTVPGARSQAFLL